MRLCIPFSKLQNARCAPHTLTGQIEPGLISKSSSLDHIVALRRESIHRFFRNAFQFSSFCPSPPPLNLSRFKTSPLHGSRRPFIASNLLRLRNSRLSMLTFHLDGDTTSDKSFLFADSKYLISRLKRSLFFLHLFLCIYGYYPWSIVNYYRVLQKIAQQKPIEKTIIIG